jgi:HK97 gp10 family phage protein
MRVRVLCVIGWSCLRGLWADMTRELNRLPEIIRMLETDVQRAVREAVETLVVPAAKSRVEYDEDKSGEHLRDAIHVEEALEGVYVVAGDKDVFWGHLVEHGTSHSAPHPFLVPSLEENRAAIVEAANAVVRRAAGGR